MLFGCMKWNKIFTFISQYLQDKRLLFITVGEALLAGTPTSTESEPHAGQGYGFLCPVELNFNFRKSPE